jgi:predicted lactoylglutathione lyase
MIMRIPSDGVTFSLADDSLGFSIDAATGVVTTNADFEVNFEDAQSQSFTVVATDAAGNASEQVVSVAINNLDEVAPSITSGDTGTAVNENSGADQVVYTATASDTDFNGLEDITFSLADESLGFSIDASTGVVTTNDDFAADYENAQSQSFTVVATDAVGNATEQLVSVAINNLDEVAPSIDSGDTATAIDENSGEGQVVYTATASDTDFNGLEDITFSLADEALGFSIDASTGVVTTNADFAADFEDAQSQSFTVVATDGAG